MRYILNLRVPTRYAPFHTGMPHPRIWYPFCTVEDTMNRWERLWMWVAWRLPKPLVKWCFYRVAAHATQGKWSSQLVPDLTVADAGDRWDSKKPGTDGWNPWNKVVHRDGGEVDVARTNIERALRGLPVPWHPSMADKEVGEGPVESDIVEAALDGRDIRPSRPYDDVAPWDVA